MFTEECKSLTTRACEIELVGLTETIKRVFPNWWDHFECIIEGVALKESLPFTPLSCDLLPRNNVEPDISNLAKNFYSKIMDS